MSAALVVVVVVSVLAMLGALVVPEVVAQRVSVGVPSGAEMARRVSGGAL